MNLIKSKKMPKAIVIEDKRKSKTGVLSKNNYEHTRSDKSKANKKEADRKRKALKRGSRP